MNGAKHKPGLPKGHIVGKVILFWCGYLLVLVLMSKVKGMVPQRWGQLVWGATSCAALFPLSLLFLRRDGCQLRDAGLALDMSSVARFLVGILIGLACYGLILLLVRMIGGPIYLTRATGMAPGALLLTGGSILALAGMEEVGFRGYPLRSLIPSLGFWPAQGIVAIAFGACHFAFGWSWSTILLGVVPSAFLFGMATVASGGLAMPVGLHAALNFAQWSVRDNEGLWKLVVAEAARARVDLVAPIIGVAVTLGATVLMWRWHVRRQARESEA